MSASRITAAAPAHAAGPVDLVVQVADGRLATKASAFTYLDAPVLSFLEPGHVPQAGGSVILHGDHFQAGARVFFGAAAAEGTPVVVSSTQITAVAAAQAPGLVDVTVENPDGQRSTLLASLRFDVDQPPPPPPAPMALHSASPISGPETGGTVVVLAGAGFDALATVTFGGAPATVTANAATSLTVSTPPHAPGPVEIAVANPDGVRVALPNAFTYVALPPAPPSLTGLDPVSGPEAGGATVVLTGTGFQAGVAVTFGGAAAVVLEQLPERLTVLSPDHPAGLVAVVVANPDGQSAMRAASYTFVASPVLALLGVAPASGPVAGGTAVTISGAGFLAGATVTFGGAAAAVGAVTATSITATTPAHAAGAVDVVVLNGDGQSATRAGGFTFVAPPPPPPPPSLAAVSPSSGSTAGGTSASISGSNFQPGATVTVGGSPATVGAVTAIGIAITTPAHAAGAAEVTVTNPDGQSATLAAGFTYLAPPLPAPVLASLSPVLGPDAGGTAVTLSGAAFTAGATVTLGGAAATVVSVTSTSIAVTTPAHVAGAVDVTVTNPDGQLSTLHAAYTFVAPPPPPTDLPAPILSAVFPASGPAVGGAVVSLSGASFQAGASVTMGGVSAVVGAVSATAIDLTAPAHPAGVVDVTVTNPDGQSVTLPAAFTYLAPPALVALAPASGLTTGGASVTLTGAGFRAGATVTFGGAPAILGVVTATSITLATPAHAAGAVAVTVANTDGQASTLAAGFTYVLPAPVIASIAPVSGLTAGGTAVTLTGTNFVAGAAVTVGGAAATVSAVTATSIAIATPVHAAGAASLVVTNPDGQASTLAGAFTYVAPLPSPVLTGLSPTSGTTAGGTQVVLSGSGFVAGVGVTFGGAAATVQGVSATTLTVVAPSHAAGAVAVAVTNPGGQSAVLAAAYTYVAPPPPPVLASLTPATGSTAGGTRVVLAGTGFAAGTTVTFDGLGATVDGLTDTAITVITPAHAAGPVDVVVTIADGRLSTLAGGFTYVAPPPPPAITSVTPNTGPLAGGTAVTLGGTGFVTGATVSFGAASGAVTALAATAVSVTSPPGAAGPVDVTVTNPDGQSVTFVGAYTYADPPPPGLPPTITSVTPTSGYVIGGTQVTLLGRDFNAPDVFIGGLAATVLSTSKTVLVVSTPPHASGPVGVTVTNADGQSATRANGYRYVPLPVLGAPTITAVTPSSGPTGGNQAVVVTGTNFFADMLVTFDGVPGTVTALTPTDVTVVTPAHAAGAVTVAVTNVDAQSATLPGGYVFVAPPPVVTAVGARGSPQAGGDLQLLAGTGLVNTVSVTFGGAACTGITSDATSGNLTCTIPPSPLGPTSDGFVDILVVNLDGQSTTWPRFHYGNPPSATSFTPDTAPRDATVVITGFDFTADAVGDRVGLQVSFGGTPAIITAKSSTQISVTVPKLNPGQYKIVVVNFDGQVSVAPGSFTAPGP